MDAARVAIAGSTSQGDRPIPNHSNFRGMRSWTLLAFVLLLLSSVLRIEAQSVRGSLAGSVTDPTGAVIPGATVQAKNVATGDASETVTTSAGTFRFPELPLGRYDVTIKI